MRPCWLRDRRRSAIQLPLRFHNGRIFVTCLQVHCHRSWYCFTNANGVRFDFSIGGSTRHFCLTGCWRTFVVNCVPLFCIAASCLLLPPAAFVHPLLPSCLLGLASAFCLLPPIVSSQSFGRGLGFGSTFWMVVNFGFLLLRFHSKGSKVIFRVGHLTWRSTACCSSCVSGVSFTLVKTATSLHKEYGVRRRLRCGLRAVIHLPVNSDVFRRFPALFLLRLSWLSWLRASLLLRRRPNWRRHQYALQSSYEVPRNVVHDLMQQHIHVRGWVRLPLPKCHV